MSVAAGAIVVPRGRIFIATDRCPDSTHLMVFCNFLEISRTAVIARWPALIHLALIHLITTEILRNKIFIFAGFKNRRNSLANRRIPNVFICAVMSLQHHMTFSVVSQIEFESKNLEGGDHNIVIFYI